MHNRNHGMVLHKREYGADAAVVGTAPGVVTLLGSFTEAHEGGVLQVGLEQGVAVSISRRSDHSVYCYSAHYRERRRWGLTGMRLRAEDRWSNLFKGVILRLQTLGARVPGLNVAIAGDLPVEIGLGSSQAVGVAFTMALSELLGFPLEPDEAAQVAYHAESRFLERSVGFAGFLGAAVAREGHALYVDCRELDWYHERWNMPGYTLALTDTKKGPCASDEDYQEREDGGAHCIRAVCGSRGLSRGIGGVVAELEARLGSLPERARRAALHVVMENHRVQEARRMLMVNDAAGLGKLIVDSHESLRDLYEVSCPEVDWLVRHTKDLHGVCGTRLSGKRGGASVVTLLNEAAVPHYEEQLDRYERIFGFQPQLFTSTASAGVLVNTEQEVR